MYKKAVKIPTLEMASRERSCEIEEEWSQGI
jgi:hypothetical protein